MSWGSIKNYSGNKAPKQSTFSTLSRLDGKLTGAETIIIEGRLEGEILVNGSIEIMQNAAISGHIKADKLSIYGKVDGNIDITDSLLIGKTAVINGDIRARTATIIAGAIISGQCSIVGISESQPGDYIPQPHKAVLANAY